MAEQRFSSTADINSIRRLIRENLTKTYSELGLSDKVCALLTGVGRVNRGVITYATGGMSGRNIDALSLATSVEMIHRASVIVDDIEDGDTIRRGRPCFHIVSGTSQALAVADLILSNALYCLGKIGLSYLNEGLEAYRDMSHGQALDVAALSHDGVDIDLPATLKTGALIRMCFRIGGQLSGLPPELIDAYGSIGLHLGCVFQLQNDINNYLGTENRGSEPGSDLLRGSASSFVLALRLQAACTPDSFAASLQRVEALRDKHLQRVHDLLNDTTIPVPASLELVVRDFFQAFSFVADQQAQNY